MKEVWKVFFRLKAEEITGFIRELPKILLGFLVIVYVVAVIMSVIFLIGHVFMMIVASFNYLNFGDTMMAGIYIIFATAFLGVLINLIFVEPIKWLRSNFKRAKRIVAQRKKREEEQKNDST